MQHPAGEATVAAAEDGGAEDERGRGGTRAREQKGLVHSDVAHSPVLLGDPHFGHFYNLFLLFKKNVILIAI